MRQARPAFINHSCTPLGRAALVDPRRFGRGRIRILAVAAAPAWSVSGELKLFATTFVIGFLFVSILIG